MFEIKSENNLGLFHVKLHRVLSPKEIMQLAALAANIMHKAQEPLHYTAAEPEEEELSSEKEQHRLGENPTSKISLGSYVEPDIGVRIRMLHYPDKKVPAVRAFRKHTGITLIGCKDIVCGNIRCPVLTMSVATEIIKDFKEIEVYATIIDAQCKNEVEG